MAIGEALKLNSTLTTLDLCFNSLGENGGVAIAEALKLNSTLTTLDLSGNSLGENSGAVCVVLKSLARNKRNTSQRQHTLFELLLPIAFEAKDLNSTHSDQWPLDESTKN